MLLSMLLPTSPCGGLAAVLRGADARKLDVFDQLLLNMLSHGGEPVPEQRPQANVLDLQ